jgi:hypothetical protein
VWQSSGRPQPVARMVLLLGKRPKCLDASAASSVKKYILILGVCVRAFDVLGLI